MSKSSPRVSRRAFMGASTLLAGGWSAAASARDDTSLWDFYSGTLRSAKYIDLTHAMAPGGPIGEGFGDFKVGPARAGVSIPGVIRKGEPFSYAKLGVAITAYDLPMDHIGTQFGPPAHMNDHGATISDIPPTVALRPLVVINVAPRVAVDPGYQATLADVKEWESRHGAIPAGSVVMIRSDWSLNWHDPQRFSRQPFPGVTLAVLQYLHLERHVLMHGHEPLDTDNTAPRFVGETWLLQHNFAQAEGVANLDLVPEAGALITIGFAKFQGGTGGFARYIGIAPPQWPHGTTIDEAPGAPLSTHAQPLRRGPDGVLR
ncbi:MAG TPA: cyclase family protein [Steroidobacteraceae bacterium]